jgi:polar amino acid transport system substrate-binding protein
MLSSNTTKTLSSHHSPTKFLARTTGKRYASPMNFEISQYQQQFLYCTGLFLRMSILLIVLALPTLTFSAQTPSPPTITLAFSAESMPPYYTISTDSNEITGVWREMLDTLFVEKLGWHVRYIFRPWQRAQNDVKLGNADGFISIVTEERLQYAAPIPTTFCCFPLHLFTYNDHPQIEQMKNIRSVDDLMAMNLQLVSNIGNGWYKDNIEKNGVKTLWLPTDAQALQFVSLQRVDGLIDLPSSINNLADTLGIEDRIMDTGVSFGQVNIHLLIGTSSPFAGRIEEINSAMHTLSKDGTFASFETVADKDHINSSSCCSCGCGQLQ